MAPRRGLRSLAFAAGVLILPVMLNILWSPVRQILLPAAKEQPLFAADPTFRVMTERAEAAFAKVPVAPNKDKDPVTFRGEALTDCEMTSGIVAVIERDAAALKALAPEMDRQPMVADLFPEHWLFNGLRPLKGGAPWYYDGLPGLADATHVMVPVCPVSKPARKQMVERLDEAGVQLTEVGGTGDFRLYRIDR